jgi:fatty-acyl-CoA synthase
MKLEGLNAVSVVGYPDERLHEVGVAFVIRSDNSPLLESHIAQHLKGKLASFKIPKHVIFVDEFPMTSSGKVQKVKLRSLARSMLD